MSEFLNTPLFGIVLSIFAFLLGVFIQKKLKTPVANPLALAIIMIVAVLLIFDIPLESYKAGGNIIAVFLIPATASLAVSIYNKRVLLKKYLIPVIVGCFTGALTCVICVVFLCKAFGISDVLRFSLIPKSVTTPIAIEISSQLGGVPAVTVAAVLITGIFGAIAAPFLIKVFKVKNPVARGIAIGTSAHAVGTSKAIELGETEGAMSGIAIAIAGISTVLICLFLR